MWIELDWIGFVCLGFLGQCFVEAGFSLYLEKNISGCYFFWGGRGFGMSSKGWNGKRKKKRVEQQKQKHLPNSVYIPISSPLNSNT